MNPQTIFAWIKQEESNFKTDKIKVGDNWDWNFRDHVQMLFHLKNGVFFSGENNYLRAFKNIMEPVLNLAYWSEDIEVKDIVFFIEGSNDRAMSFLIKKYHDEKYVRENDLDTLLDQITESDVDYGGVMVQHTNTKRPERIPLITIAFCDQTDTLGAPIGFRHNFSPSALRKMSKLGWGKKENGADMSIEELITLSTTSKKAAGDDTQDNKVPGKTIELYIVKGALREDWLKSNGDPENYVEQVQIVGFYTDEKGNKQGVTLYKKEDDGESIKFHTTAEVEGRALGRGVGESLIHPQIWSNWLQIHHNGLIEAASKVVLYTDDPEYATRNKVNDLDNLEVTTVMDGKKIFQVPTAAPVNIQLHEKSINDWFQHAQLVGSAFDPLLGKEQAAGTTFRGQERVVAQGRGLHDRRRGQRAKFIEQIYRDWIIPDMKREMTRGVKWLATLSTQEVTWVTEQLAENYANKTRNEQVLNGEEPDDKELLKQQFKQEFSKTGNKHLLEILKGELDDIEINIGINIAGKQKDLVNLTDKLLSIFQFVFTNPAAFQQAMQIPALAASFEDILEFSGLNQAEFLTLMQPPAQPPMPMQPGQPTQPGQPMQPQMMLNPQQPQ